MTLNRIVIIFVIILIFSNIGYAQKIKIGIFTTHNIKSFIFTTEKGRYQLVGDKQTVISIKPNSVLNFLIGDTSIIIKDLNNFIGSFKYIEIDGIEPENIFKIKGLIPEISEKIYDDNLILFSVNDFFRIINNVELENYITGVVESESGTKATLEYYKTQAIITRTYALKNFNRHIDEGYNLCSEVHCQAYHNKSINHNTIAQAVKLTRGLVIVDTTLSLIIAAFHSNSGGQTSPSEIVWLTPKSYLKSVVDTFSTKKSNYIWTETIPLWKWKTYLIKNGIKIPENTTDSDFIFNQPYRRMYYVFKNDSILLKNIRNDFKLRSTFFSVKVENNNVILSGKGYGHGVGLSQQGAMKMAEMGISYRNIINFYYKNVFIVSLRALKFFKE